MTFCATHPTQATPEAQAAALLAGAAAAKFSLSGSGLNWGPDVPFPDFDGVTLAADGAVERFEVHAEDRNFDLGALVDPLLSTLTGLDASGCKKATGVACARNVLLIIP